MIFDEQKIEKEKIRKPRVILYNNLVGKLMETCWSLREIYSEEDVVKMLEEEKEAIKKPKHRPQYFDFSKEQGLFRVDKWEYDENVEYFTIDEQ